MGAWKENPRYNVVTLRLSDDELAQVDALVSLEKNRSVVLRELLAAGWLLRMKENN